MKTKKTKNSTLLKLPDANTFDDLGETLLYNIDFTPCSFEDLVKKRKQGKNISKKQTTRNHIKRLLTVHQNKLRKEARNGQTV